MLKEIAIIVVCFGVAAQSLPVIMFYPQPSSADVPQHNNAVALKQADHGLHYKGGDHHQDFRDQLESILHSILNEPNALLSKISDSGSSSSSSNNGHDDGNMVIGSEFERRQHWSQGFLPGGK